MENWVKQVLYYYLVYSTFYRTVVAAKNSVCSRRFQPQANQKISPANTNIIWDLAINGICTRVFTHTFNLNTETDMKKWRVEVILYNGGEMIMVDNIDVNISGKKGTCSLTGIPVVKANYSIISKKVADQIDPFEVRKMTARWTTIKVDVALVDVEAQNKKNRCWVIISDLPQDAYVATATLSELRVQNL